MGAYNKLWTKTAFRNVPEIGSQEGKGDDAVAYVKLFCIRNDQRWYVLEFDPETGRAFCLLTDRDEASYGYSAICEVNPGDWGGEDMQSVNNRMRFPPFERDSSFSPTSVAEIKAKMGTGCPA